MKKLLFLMLLFPNLGFSQQVITADVENFWKAYDQVVVEKDPKKQIKLLNQLFIDKGTQGLRGIMQARQYTAEEYVQAINRYPKFWSSVRSNTLKANEFSKQIRSGIEKLRQIYPDLKPANTYFEIGVLRTNGTIIDGMALIGSELALTDKTTVSSEFDTDYPHLRPYFDSNPIDNVVFLNVHEYIHTQQLNSTGNSLLAQAVLEGVAEFLTEIALDQASPNPQIAFGYKNEPRIRAAFEKEMFSPYFGNWIWNNTNNAFGMRDLAYFAGYAICKNYYDKTVSKAQAVKKMIELDYNNEAALTAFVNHSGYFDKPMQFYKEQFENARPKLVGIKQFEIGNQQVDPQIKTITLQFSQPMNRDTRGFDFGPLGENNVLRVERVIGFSEDGKSFSFEVNLAPDKRYQSLVTERFRNNDNIPLQPFLIDFKTR